MNRIYNPLVSVIIPVYKVEKYLRASVLSVLEQSYKNIEIILVDDGSPDKCPEICDEFAREYQNISVIHKQNGGLSEARNVGINQTSGEYILFLDSDDTLSHGALEKLVMLALDKDADVVIPDRYIQINEETGKTAIRYHIDKTCFIEEPFRFALEVLIGKGRAWRATSLLYKSSLIKTNNVKFPVGYIAEDVVFNLRFMKLAGKLAFYEGPTLNCTKRQGSITAVYNKNFDQVLYFIDDQVKHFIKETNYCIKCVDNKRKELLCQNTINYITIIFSSKCNLSKLERHQKADEFLENEMVSKAFTIQSISPYFDRRLAIIYYKIIFKLIKSGRKNTAYFIAQLADRIS